MQIIESLENLIHKLNTSETIDHSKIIKEINIPIRDFEALASWDDNCYTRNCIHRSDQYELILLCWNKGSTTPIHGHDGQKCWVYQIKGQLTEVRYDKLDSGDLVETNRMNLVPGKLSFMNNAMGYHQLMNTSDGRAMTLHAYVLPINSCEVYCDDKQDFEDKELEYDTIIEDALVDA